MSAKETFFWFDHLNVPSSISNSFEAHKLLKSSFEQIFKFPSEVDKRDGVNNGYHSRMEETANSCRCHIYVFLKFQR